MLVLTWYLAMACVCIRGLNRATMTRPRHSNVGDMNLLASEARKLVDAAFATIYRT